MAAQTMVAYAMAAQTMVVRTMAETVVARTMALTVWARTRMPQTMVARTMAVVQVVVLIVQPKAHVVLNAMAVGPTGAIMAAVPGVDARGFTPPNMLGMGAVLLCGSLAAKTYWVLILEHALHETCCIPRICLLMLLNMKMLRKAFSFSSSQNWQTKPPGGWEEDSKVMIMR